MSDNQHIDHWKKDRVDGGDMRELTTLNLGPTHPATHGIFQNVLTMDGEIILDSVQTIGYIHRAFEKIAERRPFYQITTLTDRMNYCSSPINNMGWHMAVEKLCGIELPKRVEYLRVIAMELARIADHVICNTIIGQDAGATTPFLYVYQWREKIYEVYEEICGARLTTNMGRIGGFERNFSELAFQRIRSLLKEMPAGLKEFDDMLIRNRIFMDRTINCGAFPVDRALAYGFTGPNLRACGVDYDVRVADPYSSYEDFDFTIPVGQNGDVYDRFMVRQEEMRQSLSIIRQALEKLDKMSDKTTYHADVPEWVLPPKEAVYSEMEALIYHFKLVMGETEIPRGEIYHCVEGGNGELGFYIVSDGGRNPYRVHFRRPCYIYYQAFPEIIKGSMLSDAILTMSSMNVIAGELDA
ncbi:MAG: NADH-quinone oxidoreductase subunit D [Flavobacteriales bacterium]|nr:NADH-quinone oxidoreductase subunit D [Flavobacteriales bacterium]MBK6944156.1 NADH-quinone oxidoreductase subunit D [Flavobacteriales bacterium]MBK7240357.1 NADH-quinone oxidoreductase subunit D [Flavobacteriales bacterium]MBK7295349.1 NADH-quinone oxidoreductase subunit D [Flavobacteriales bacterium]MBK9533823.1 NADH-quinone oxidoreductase subunit D [Flavobacteriales bacterium]